jgi:CO/xanthine dehydrogenase FAD-binding subunit
MRPITDSRATDVDDVLASAAANAASAFLAGSTNEVDLIRAGNSHPRHVARADREVPQPGSPGQSEPS